jgi:ABC-2 type transport system permease protein
VTNPAVVWLVATRELRARMRTRSFLIITLLIGTFSAGAVVAVELMSGVFEENAKHLGVVGPGGDPFEQQLVESATLLGVDVEVKEFPDRAVGEAALRDGKLDALVTADGALVFESKEDSALSAAVNRALYVRALPEILAGLGLTYEDVQPLVAPLPAPVTLLDPSKAGEQEDNLERTIVAQAATMVLFLTLVLYGQGLLYGVVEEKASRVVEVLMGTLRPEQLLAGKVIGIIIAAICQLAVGFGAAAVALAVVGSAEIPSVALDVALVSGAFLILGLVSYGFVYAAVGATVSRQSEAESAQAPLSMALMVPYLLSLTVLTDKPDGVLARVLSLLPPTAPVAMPARVALGDPLLIEIVVSVALMFPWIAVMIWLAGRLYSGAILRSGPRVGLLAAWRGAGETGAEA